MSNISIGCGTKVAFFPLIANWADWYEEHYGIKNDGTVKLGPETRLVSNDGCLQLYGLFSLPIFGTYNDYGGVENIEESVTTKAIEKHFGITIDEFLDCVTNSRDFYDYFYGPFNVYVSKDDAKLLNDYNVKFNLAWMEKIGIKKVKGEKNTFEHPMCEGVKVVLEKWTAPKDSYYQNGYVYKIYKDGEVVGTPERDTYDIRKNFFKAWHKTTGYYLLVPNEHQKKINAIQNVGGMFVHYSIYRHLVECNIDEYGNKDDMSQGGDAGLNDFSLKLTGVDIEIPEQKMKASKYSAIFDELQEKVKTHLDAKENEDKFKESLTRIYGNKANDRDKEMAKMFYERKNSEDEYDEAVALNNLGRILIRLLNSMHPLDRNVRPGFYLNADRSSWQSLKELYTEAIAEGTVKQDLIDYSHFYWNAYQNNRVFMPQSNGCQFGNNYATRALAKKVHDIMDGEIGEREAEKEEYV